MSPESTDPGRIEAVRLWKRFRTDPHPGLMGQAARLREGGTRWRWALRDISLAVQPGESVGMVGVNGSGKSTLLKMLTGTMVPTVGDLAVGGRVGALIELQAGLHPELSGRENALAYGTLLGLSRREARESLDDVLDFAGVDDAVDRQVKFYSTGMRLRLGFSIAANLGAPVLLVDEVLAVADAEFQATAMHRLRDLRSAGTTMVVVSHDLSVIDGLCDRTVWLDDGIVADDGPTGAVLAAYRAARDPRGVTPPVRVLVAHNRYRTELPSGENTIVDAEVEGLRARGIAVDLLLAESDDIADFGLGARLALPLRPTWSVTTRRRFRRLVAEHRPDVVHLHNPFPLLSPMVVRWAKDAGLPVVQSVHNVRHACLAGTWFRDGADCRECAGHRWPGPGVRHGCHTSGHAGAAALAFAQGVHRGTWSLVDRYLAVSESVTEALAFAGVAEDRIEVRPHGVEDPGPLGPPGAAVLYAGRLTQEKGVDLLLAAWRHGGPPGASLRLAGDGPLRPDVEAAARLDPSIVVLGLLDRADMRRELTGAGIVVVPSRGPESCPTIVLEALAAGRPVVATGVGGLPELIDVEVGALAEGAPAALAAALVEVSADRSRRGAAARARYQARFTRDRALDRLVEVYAELAA